MAISLPKSPTINIKVNEIGGSLVPSATSGGVTVKNQAITHSQLSGLSNDDHTQYSIISSGAGLPGTTPTRVGELYINESTGEAYLSTGTTSSADWILATGNISSQSHTWAIQGQLTEIIVPPMYILKESTETVEFIEMRYSISSGTSIDIKFQKNGVDITGSSVTVDITPTTTVLGTPVAFNHEDELKVIVSNLINNPKDLSLSVRLRRTIL